MSNPGLTSLAGFAYQIKVFILYLLDLKNGSSIWYEKLDDVSIEESNIDARSINCKNLISSNKNNILIQVKNVEKIDKKTKKQVLFNWLLCLNKNNDITKCILFSKDTNVSLSLDLKQLYSEIVSSDKKETALITQVKKIYLSDENKFMADANEIYNKVEYKSASNIDEEINSGLAILLHKSGLSEETVYDYRVNDLLGNITTSILASASRNEEFRYTFEQLVTDAEVICKNISDVKFDPLYVPFKKRLQIENVIDDLKENREYKQLSHCELSINAMMEYLTKFKFYEHSRYGMLEVNHAILVDEIEEECKDNFDEVVSFINNDQPKERLKQTMSKSISKIESKQLTQGAYVFLTKENTVDERKISWKDD